MPKYEVGQWVRWQMPTSDPVIYNSEVIQYLDVESEKRKVNCYLVQDSISKIVILEDWVLE